MTEKTDMLLTSNTTFVIEYQHSSSWQTSCSADQVFDAGQREAKNALQMLLNEHGKGRYRIVSADTSVIMARRKA